MSEPFSYSTTFILDKAHFNECYSASVAGTPTLNDYFKAIVLTLFGIGLVLFSDVIPYMAWFVFALGIVEALSVHYRKSWWVMRQMLSKAAKSEVTLTIDNEGIKSNSYYHNQEMHWPNIQSLLATENGWLVQTEQGKNYISNHCLTDEMKLQLSEFSKTGS